MGEEGGEGGRARAPPLDLGPSDPGTGGERGEGERRGGGGEGRAAHHIEPTHQHPQGRRVVLLPPNEALNPKP